MKPSIKKRKAVLQTVESDISYISGTVGNGRRARITADVLGLTKTILPEDAGIPQPEDPTLLYVTEAPDSAEEGSTSAEVISHEKNRLGLLALAANTANQEMAGKFLSADVMPTIFTPEGRSTRSLKKPRSLAEVAANMGELLLQAKDGVCEYRLQSSTTVGAIESGELSYQQNTMLESIVHLDAKKLQEIALELQQAAREFETDDEIIQHSQYMQMFQEINGSDFSLYNVAGGFCLEVFVAMGIVTSIDGCELDAVDPQDAYDAVYGGLYTAITTVSPSALQNMYDSREHQLHGEQAQQKNVMETLTEIPYLHDLTDRVMQLR